MGRNPINLFCMGKHGVDALSGRLNARIFPRSLVLRFPDILNERGLAVPELFGKFCCTDSPSILKISEPISAVRTSRSFFENRGRNRLYIAAPFREFRAHAANSHEFLVPSLVEN
jgi:hypothetical protein